MKSTVHSLRSTACFSLRPAAYRLRPGFTLIEVLVAMTVLSIMVLMVANIFQGSSAAWNIGTQKADMNIAARAALDFMVRELESAVAGPVDANSPVSPLSFEVKNSGKEVYFVSLVGDVNSGRALRNASFYHGGNRLMYARQTQSPYSTLPDQLGANMLITNVLDIDVSIYKDENDLIDGKSLRTSLLYQLPICIDVALVMLSDDDMRRYNQLSGADQADFGARNSKVYATRIYCSNRKGYSAR